jgi:hypothetical protein
MTLCFSRSSVEERPVKKEIPSIPELILGGKLRLKNPGIVLKVFKAWSDAGLWVPKATEKGKGAYGYPLGLTKGLRYVDGLLMGIPPEYILYQNSIGRKWKLDEITHAIQQFALGAFNPEYYPAGEDAKKNLRRMPLDRFFCNDRVVGEPTEAIHTPFLFYVRNGAILNDNAVKEKTPKNERVFRQVMRAFYHLNDAEPTLSVRDKNRIVTFSDVLWDWFVTKSEKLPEDRKSIRIFFDVMTSCFSGWTPPFGVGLFTSERTRISVLATLDSYCTAYSVPRVAPRAETVVRSTEPQYILTPTTLLKDVGGDMIEGFIRYAQQNDVIVDEKTLDQSKIFEDSEFALRSVLRRYKQGIYTICKRTEDSWQDILKAGTTGQRAKLFG